MKIEFHICDVFTERRFGGNPLAVITDAQGLETAQMQAIAREFGFSESTFVLPAEGRAHQRVRIFTPTREVPFAGHPNVGTAFELARLGRLPDDGVFRFAEEAGEVRVASRPQGGFQVRAPAALELGRELPAAWLAQALGLPESAIDTTAHAPMLASVGLPFVMVRIADRAALADIRVDMAALDVIADAGVMPDIHAYVMDRDTDGTADGGGTDRVDIHARMFAPLDGVAEDPATGSANCALVGLLARLDKAADLDLELQVAQGTDMGRPSRLAVRAEKRAGQVAATFVGGTCVHVASGHLHLD